LKSLRLWIFVAIASLTLNAQTRLSVASFVAPEYPPLAAVARITGDVTLDIALNENGTVASSRVVSGHPLLQAAAHENSLTWRFEASDGKKSGNEAFTLTYRFRLSDTVRCERQPTRVTIDSYNLVSILGSPPVICDPVMEIKKKHWYWPW
jgi:TonB family protein